MILVNEVISIGLTSGSAPRVAFIVSPLTFRSAILNTPPPPRLLAYFVSREGLAAYVM